MKSLCLLFVLFVPQVLCAGEADMSLSPVEVQKYFPELEGDMTKVTWIHRCNSRAKLENALKSNIMMIEADIIAGHLIGAGGGAPIPVMGHPPETVGDISLEQFLDTVLRSRAGKGIKLDFKSVAIFKESENVLEQFLAKAEVDFPVWVNADILLGPGDPTDKEPVDAAYFLRTCVDKFPTATISAGWTVDVPKAEKLNYNSTHIDQMTSRLAESHVVHPVTFAVHSGIASNSVNTLTSLVQSSVAGTSLTLWCAKDDWVDYGKLRQLIDTIGRDKVFIDMPDDMKDKLLNPLESRANVLSSSLALMMIALLFMY